MALVLLILGACLIVSLFGKDGAAEAFSDTVQKILIGLVVFVAFNIALFYGLIFKLLGA